ncbi:hypothetical protein HHI36_019768 [Cryptolaemus montrouzieri]|uniref:Uncharacterized protein n=1 Tax=Cryptolaemus montrouzieri TaxID=559131 RepID=A0ABD2N8B6_9CUCU
MDIPLMNTLAILSSLVYLGIPYLVDAQCRPSVTTVGGSFKTINKSPICSGDLIFSESFDWLNEGLWNHELQADGCGNGEFQKYMNDRSISYVQNGKLFIKPKVVGDAPLNE